MIKLGVGFTSIRGINGALASRKLNVMKISGGLPHFLDLTPLCSGDAEVGRNKHVQHFVIQFRADSHTPRVVRNHGFAPLVADVLDGAISDVPAVVVIERDDSGVFEDCESHGGVKPTPALGAVEADLRAAGLGQPGNC